MKFNLTPEQRVRFITIYDNSPSKKEAYSRISHEFKIADRTVRKYAKKLGLSRKYKDRVENITVNTPTVVKPHRAKVLLFDIETAPMSAYVWGLWNQNIGTNLAMLQSDWFMLTWAAKWLFEEEILSDKLTPSEAVFEDDSRITKSLWDLINEADILIAHNGKKFDIRKINTRFLKHDLPHPMPYEVIDTLEHARKQLGVSSNKLDYLGEFLKVGRKVEHEGFKLWKACCNGDEEALARMETYNIGDITLLEDVYLKMRRFIKPHPNMGLHITEDIECCPTCGHDDLEAGGTYNTSVSSFEAFRCTNCGSVGRKRKNIVKTKNLITPIAR